MYLRQAYPDDLSDKEWVLIRDLIEYRSPPRGRKAKYSAREMLNAIFYLLRTGCSWRHLPHDFPPWKSVYTQFRRWRLKGLFIKLHDDLRIRLRILLKRAVEPTAGIVDSQSVRTTEKGGSKVMMEPRKLTVERGI